MMRPPLARSAGAGYLLSCRRRCRPPPSFPSSFTGGTPPEAAAKSNGVATRGWSSSGFATPGGDASAAEVPGLPSAFPWREAPDNRGVRGLVERAMYSVMQHQHRRFLRAATKLDDADDDAFLRAAEMAFVQVAAGVFQMPAHQVIAPLADGEGDEGKSSSESGDRGRRRDGLPVWDIPEGALVDPRDVMHKDLADFYVQAAVAAKVSRSTPFYRLHGLRSCEISNVNVLWGAQRGDLPEEGETIEIWGSKYVLKSVLEDIKAISRYRVSKDRDVLDKPLSSIRKTTVQVDVDIGCTETFFVSDDRTEEIVQGSKAFAVRKHRLRLESSPFLKRDFQWSVVDLDDWMKGNTFW
ncbi:unnamed protein product [Ectocarpus sp. CCAP 1310/34]|nr:unnamed protein product [Ectocarpus sp. CCAP 1310/34]